MLLGLKRLVQWLGLAAFQMVLHLLPLLVFPTLLALRMDGLATGLSWWNVFVPFFNPAGFSTCFTTILTLRLFQDWEKHLAVLRLFWVLMVLSLKCVFEMLLCQKLVEQTRDLWFVLTAPLVFILLQLLVIFRDWEKRAAQLNCGASKLSPYMHHSEKRSWSKHNTAPAWPG
ncbi:transmembrane protein 203-like [Marmota monax]|uniref:transmembrane protein 203-like n=1 Tax=Marmota monax TaxID=9995 RepID=UPI001EB01154|nr:transmembrane protein 203-like [Marmota monax]